MVKLKTAIQDNIEPEETESYLIESTEQIKTQVQGFDGLRVVLSNVHTEDEATYATMLWTREVASSNSKLGAFITAFSDYIEKKGLIGKDNEPLDPADTDNWLDHTVKIVSWRAKKREIVVVK